MFKLHAKWIYTNMTKFASLKKIHMKLSLRKEISSWMIWDYSVIQQKLALTCPGLCRLIRSRTSSYAEQGIWSTANGKITLGYSSKSSAFPSDKDFKTCQQFESSIQWSYFSFKTILYELRKGNVMYLLPAR